MAMTANDAVPDRTPRQCNIPAQAAATTGRILSLQDEGILSAQFTTKPSGFELRTRQTIWGLVPGAAQRLGARSFRSLSGCRVVALKRLPAPPPVGLLTE